MEINELKVAVVGGGSSYTPELAEGIIARRAELPVGEVWLVDIPSGRDKLDAVAGLVGRMAARSGAGIKVHAAVDRRAALDGADFVISQFRVGGLEARIRDERIPLKHGCIGQETTGPGGFMNALRTIPAILGLCRDMEELCPDAWLINFTNPSGIVTEAVLNHSSVKAIGLCNCPIGMQDGIARQFGCPAREVRIDFVGLNHLLFARRIYVRGEDVTEQAVARAHEGGEIMEAIPSVAAGRRFFKSLGMVPIGYLKYYYFAKEMYARCLRQAGQGGEGGGVRGEVVRKIEDGLFALYRDPGLAAKPPQLSERGGAHYSDAACDLMRSIHGDRRDVQVVCVRNGGANLDLPEDAVIERNCVVGRDGASPVPLGHMPPKARGLVQAVKAYEQLTVEAAVRGDRDAALQALALHPLVPSANVAMAMLDEMMLANKEYLPQFGPID